MIYSKEYTGGNQWKRLPLFLLPLFMFVGGCQETNVKKEVTLRKACDYLWGQQAEDGGWHSQTHSILRGGESLTAFILWSLLEVPESLYKHSADRKRKGLDFIRNHIKDGRLGLSNPVIVDYPNYATAYALRLLSQFGNTGDSMLISEMGNYLLKQQFTEQRGITRTHPAYGAWGFGETNLIPGRHGHVDLSHTRRVLEALAQANLLTNEPKTKAFQFLKVLQKDSTDNPVTRTVFDGGFYASSVTVGTNKGGFARTSIDTLFFASYATTTCDGLMALKALELDLAKPNIEAAKKWLIDHKQLELPEGIPEDSPGRWDEVMKFYHLAVRAEAFKAMGHSGNWKTKIKTILQKEQQDNGSFFNPVGAANKEDDPLLATAFAIIALSNIQDMQ